MLPTEALAEAVAAEWAAQTGEVDLDTMPLTRLAWGALSLDEEHRAVAAEQITAFAGSDLLRYFADGPAGLVDREQRRWGPVIDWAEAASGRALPPHAGHRAPAAAARDAGADRRTGPRGADDFALTGLAAAAGLFGSAILAFALRRASSPPRPLSSSRASTRPSRRNAGASTPKPPPAPTRWPKEAMTLGQWFEAL